MRPAPAIVPEQALRSALECVLEERADERALRLQNEQNCTEPLSKNQNCMGRDAHATAEAHATGDFALSNLARGRMLAPGEGAVFTADWRAALMIHFAVPAKVLQSQVPFELDLWQGEAIVSLVAFTQAELRPAATHWRGALLGGDTRVGRWLRKAVLAPLGHHAFLNIRTYVKNPVAGGEPGIFFVAEYLANRLATWIGPPLYGLPYSYGRITYAPPRLADLPVTRRAPSLTDAAARQIGARGFHGHIDQPRTGRVLAFHTGALPADAVFAPSVPGSADAFCMERYTAFTERSGVLRRFRIYHRPWQQVRVAAAIDAGELAEDSGPWFTGARLIGANYSPGVENVWIGPARRV